MTCLKYNLHVIVDLQRYWMKLLDHSNDPKKCFFKHHCKTTRSLHSESKNLIEFTKEIIKHIKQYDIYDFIVLPILPNTLKIISLSASIYPNDFFITIDLTLFCWQYVFAFFKPLFLKSSTFRSVIIVFENL